MNQKEQLIEKINLILVKRKHPTGVMMYNIPNSKVINSLSIWLDKLPNEKLFELDKKITDLVKSYNFKFENSELEYTIPYPKDDYYDSTDDNPPPFEEGDKWRKLFWENYKYLLSNMCRILSYTKFFYEYTKTDLINLTKDYDKYKEQEYKTYKKPDSSESMKKVSNRLTSFLEDGIDADGRILTYITDAVSFQKDYPYIVDMFISYQLLAKGNPVNPYNWNKDYRVEENWIDNFIKLQNQRLITEKTNPSCEIQQAVIQNIAGKII